MSDTRATFFYGLAGFEPSLGGDDGESEHTTAVLREFKLALVEHGLRRAPQMFIAVAESMIKANALASPKRWAGSATGADWNARLDAACERLGVRPDGDAGWYLAIFD